MMLESPRWLIRLSNIGIGVVLVGGTYLAIAITHRYLTRVVVPPVPSLAELADAARHADAALVTAAGDASQTSPAPSATRASLTIGGPSNVDGVIRAAQVALARGRLGEAHRLFGEASLDSGNASAALGSSLLSAWRADEGGTRRALARAVAGRERLSPPEQRLLDAHQRWVGGDIHGSDSVYRILLSEVKDDPTLWYAASVVHRHDGGVIDSALIAYGSPVGRRLVDQPTRRTSPVGAVAALWRVLQLSPFHEAARLDLTRFATVFGDRRLVERLAWGAELYGVEPGTRLAMRVLAADAKRDTAAWTTTLRLAESHRDPQEVFAAAGALATSAGVLNPMSLWHAAELLVPLSDPLRQPPAIVAIAHAWRGQLLSALRRPAAALEEFDAAAAIDTSLGLPLAAWAAWLGPDVGDSVRLATRVRLERWSGSVDSTGAGRDWLHPHRGLEPQLRSYAIGLLSASLGDTARVLAEAATLAGLAPAVGDTSITTIMAAALRGEVALLRGDMAAAVAATNSVGRRVPPLWRDHSPFTGRVHARYRRAFALQRSWENEGARIAYVAFFSPTLPELSIYRYARARFDATP